MEAKVELVEGTAEIIVDGQPVSRTLGRMAEPGYLGQEKVMQFAGTGIPLFFSSPGAPTTLRWDGADGIYFGVYEAHLDRILRAKPDALFILFTGLLDGAPYGWLKGHEDQLIARHDGSRIACPSFASRVWERDCERAFRRFVEHWEGGPYADHIVGYHILHGSNEHLMNVEGDGGYVDFSDVFRDGFREWLRERYDNDEARLQDAWRDAAVTFENAEVPTPQEREVPGDESTFNHVDAHGMKVADFYRCYNELFARQIAGHARAVKEGCENRKIVAMMGAYQYIYPNLQDRPQASSQVAAKKLFESPHIDMFHSPYNYWYRCFGGSHFSQLAPNSVLLHGKVYGDQIDSKPHLRIPINWNARNRRETEHMLKRDVAHSVTRNGHHYWYEMHQQFWRGQRAAAGNAPLDFDSPQIRSLIRRGRLLGEQNRDAHPEPVAQVALFTSMDSVYYQRLDAFYQNLYVEALHQWVMPWLGTPFDEYLLEDLPLLERSYKVYVFPNALYVPAELRREVTARLAADGATAVWFYAPGFVDQDGPALENIRELTGINLAAEERAARLQVKLADSGHAFTRELPPTLRSFGMDIDPMTLFQSKQEWLGWRFRDRQQYRLEPVFYVDDDDARILGHLEGLDRPGLAVKESGDARHVYCAAPLPPVGLMQAILKDSGVHLYSRRDDLVYANARYVVLCARGHGRRTLHLPRECDLRNAWTDKPLAEGVSEWTFEARHGDVRWFRME